MKLVEAELDRTRPTMPNLWSLVKDPEEFWGDLGTQGRHLLKELLEGTMEAYRDEWVAVPWHQPATTRKTYRNGCYRRKRWPTALGLLENVRVPRCRDKAFTQDMLTRLDHHRAELGQSAVDLLLAGVSTRRVGELLERIIRLPVSAGQVSRLAKRLDEAVRAFHTQALPDEYLYLVLDAIYLKARGTPRLIETGLRRTRKRVVLVAYGVTTGGIKRIIDFRVAQSESEAAWRNFLWSLYRRGLEGAALKLIATDGCGGLIGAVQEVYPFVPRQRCWFHKLQNVSSHVRRKDQTRVLRGLQAVYKAEHRRGAEKAVRAWAAVWRERYPKVVQSVEVDLPELLAFLDVPTAHRRMVRTTNPIERRFREVRRRTDSIGTFVNDASLERIVYGLVAYYNTKYATKVCKEFRKVRSVA